ncbi:MAG: maltose acetyltransferase domain-containing protein, partial [Paracoccus sp. (in: a-proteobacteria)]
MSEREKMQAGQWYNCLDPELEPRRQTARRAVHQHNTRPPWGRGGVAPLLAS